jgi:preprotein translocase subunit YajC
MMAGPSIGDFVIAFLPLLLFVGLYVFIIRIMRRQTKAIERIADALEKRGGP